jgi:hypothetical protein
MKTGIFLPTRLDRANHLEAAAKNRIKAHIKSEPVGRALRVNG